MRATNLPICFGLAAALAAASSIPFPVAAGDRAAGRQKALQCQTCHGLDGMAKLPDAPHLAGQNEIYLVKSMRDYKTGARQNDMMTLVMRDLTDADIANLAAFYAGIEPSFTGQPTR
jgi:cytochrome c553